VAGPSATTTGGSTAGSQPVIGEHIVKLQPISEVNRPPHTRIVNRRRISQFPSPDVSYHYLSTAKKIIFASGVDVTY
jgi:hypothetical protein